MHHKIPPEIGDLMHDIGGLVTAINGWSSVALERARDGEVPVDDLTIVQEESAILADIVRETMHVVRFGSPRISKPVGLSRVIAQLIRTSDRGRSAKVRLRDHTEHGVSRGPPAFVRRAVQNPLYNALRYARQRIDIDVMEEGPFVLVTIADDGPGLGVDPEAAFHRPTGGSGARMGLASARWCAELLGGSMRFGTPDHDQGAVVEIRIPAPEGVAGESRSTSRCDERLGE